MSFPLKFQFVEVKPGKPRDMGIQYGVQARDKILSGIAGYRELFTQTSGDTWEEIVRCAERFIPVAKKFTPNVLEEVMGIAEGCGVTTGEAMVLNCRYEITKFPAPSECTSFALLGETTADGKPCMGQNWDYRAGILDNTVILHMAQPDGTRILGLTEAGQVIRHGMSSRGIGLGTNNLQSVSDKRGTAGLPVLFLRRVVMSSKDFAEARKLIEEMPREVSCNFMLASSDGFAVDLEGYPGGADHIDPTDGMVTHANHFEVDPAKEALETSPRSSRLRDLLVSKRGEIDVPYIKRCLADHENYPKAICRHPADPGLPLAKRGITVASAIYELAAGVGHICAGPPCQGEYVRYEV